MSYPQEMPRNWLTKFLDDAATHPTPEKMFDFLFEKDNLTKQEIDDTEKHVADCDRCRQFVQNITDNNITKEMILSAPSVFDM